MTSRSFWTAIVLLLAVGSLIFVASLVPRGLGEAIADRRTALEEQIAELKAENEKLKAEFRARPKIPSPSHVAFPPELLAEVRSLIQGLEAERSKLLVENRGKAEELGQVSREFEGAVTRLRGMEDLLERLRKEAAQTKVEEFLKLPVVASFSERERNQISELVRQLGEVPEEWQILALIPAEGKFQEEWRSWNDRWAKNQDELKGNLEHPVNRELLAEKERILEFRKQELDRILGTERGRRIHGME